jgi:hypothetical protein
MSATVHHREFARADLAAYFVLLLNGLSLVVFEQLHPLEQQFLIFEEDLLLLVYAVPVTDLKPEPIVDLVDALDSESFQADHE